MKFKAAILLKLNNDLVIDYLNMPLLKTGQVIVKLKKSRICGSQIGEIQGIKGNDKFLPHLLGHEGVGKVMEIGPGVKKVKKDDKVILTWIKGEGIQSEPPKYLLNNKIINAGFVTTFNEYAVVSENRLVKIEKEIKDNLAVLCADVVPTGFNNISKLIKFKLGSNILIIGAGGMGLGTILASYLSGANKICVVDKFKFKILNSLKYGTNMHFIYNQNHSVSKNYKKFELQNGKIKFDYVVDFSGNPETMQWSFDLLHSEGIFLSAGVMNYKKKLSLNTLQINLGKKLIGSKGGSTTPDKEIPKFISLINQRKININNFFSHNEKLENINKLINLHLNGKVINSLINF